MKVKRIRKVGKRKVYDITTVTHNFVANGIVVHNSMATPHVAGLVTLMKQAHERLLGKTLTLDEIMTMLKELGHEKTNDEGYGPITWGMYEEWLSTTYGIEI